MKIRLTQMTPALRAPSPLLVPILLACFTLAGSTWAQSPVSLTVATGISGPAIAPNFGVFSFETGSLQYGNGNYNPNGYFFSSSNTQLVTVFKNLGVKSIRIGGDSVDGSYIPSTADIDALYGFLGAAGVKTVFSLDLAGGTPAEDASEAAYVWDRYATNTLCFAIGNEPDEYGSKDPAITNFASYFEIWQNFAAAVTAAAPGAPLGGPDNDSAANSWAPDFADAEEGSTNVLYIHYHYKPLGNAAAETPMQMISEELSSNLDTSDYPACYDTIAAPALAARFSYRFTEFNDYYVGSAGTTNMDDFFATALFALDALHWWAANGCLGLHFHTGVKGFHAAFYIDGNGNYQLYPLGYGVAAFSVGGSGDVAPLIMTNADQLNLTAYDAENGTNLFITIINKENGSGARNAAVTISPDGFISGNVAAMFLVQTNGDVAATNGITLGGAPISGTGPWQGQWTAMGVLTNGQCIVSVPAASAAIVRIQATAAEPPAITRNLPAQVILEPNQNYDYCIGADGVAPLNYQWYRDATPISGGTNASLAVTTGSPGDHSYFVVVTNYFGSITSSVSTLTVISPPTNSFAAFIKQLNPAGYWPMHEAETAAPGDIETNYGSLGLLGTGFYPDWAANSGAFIRQVSGALAGDSDTAAYFNYSGPDNTGGTTNSLYVPHTSPLATLAPPFTVECWFDAANNGHADYYVWSQCGYEGLNAGKSGAGQGKVCGIQLYWGPAQMSVQFYDNSSTVSSFNVNDAFGQWIHLALTCDSNTNLTLYTNGVQAGNTYAAAGKYSPDYWTPFTAGNGRGNGRAASGSLDELAVYPTNLSSSEILAHFETGTNTAPKAPYFELVTNDRPVIYLRMDSPAYSPPPVSAWPVLTNCGYAGANGVYTPGVMPGAAPGPGGPAGGPYPGLAGLSVPQFGGVSSFADAGNAPTFNPTGSNAGFSHMAFFRGNPCDNRVQSIAGHGTNSWQLDVTTNGCIVFNAGNGNEAAGGTGQAPGDMTTTGVYNDGHWHQIVAVNQTNFVSIYVDGELDTSGVPDGVTTTSAIPGNLDDVMIGSDPGYTNNPAGVGRNFAGQICDVAFFTNALTAAQIQTIYLTAATPRPETLSFARPETGGLELNWSYGTLQQATNVEGPFLDVTSAAAPWIVPATNSQEFYRIREN